MTRFARASGSKSSNERVAEDATSWSEIKEQIEKSNQKKDEDNKQKEADAMRLANYRKFLEDEKDSSKKEEWCNFSDDEKTKNQKITKSSNIKIKKKKKQNKRNESVDSGNEGVEGNDDKRKEKIVKTHDDSGSEPETQKIDKTGKKLKNNKIIKNKEVENTEDQKMNEEDSAIKANKKLRRDKQKKNKRDAKIKFKSNEAKSTDEGQENEESVAITSKTPLDDSNIKVADINLTTDNIEYNKKGFPIKRKLAKPKDSNSEHKRRKPIKNIMKIVINGQQVEVVNYDGFPVMKADYDRLADLKKSMISKGIPKSEVNVTMKLERRKAEKALTKEKKKVCFHCRKSGHVLSECPEIGSTGNVQTIGTGICFKCGSTEHTHWECKVNRAQEFKFAECFVCKEQGHIARQCPDNPRGMYPKGGGCRVCGDVTHLKKDCPQFQKDVEDNAITLPTSGSIEGLEDHNINKPFMGNTGEKKYNKIIKF